MRTIIVNTGSLERANLIVLEDPVERAL